MDSDIAKDTECLHKAYTVVYGAKRCAEPDCLKYLGEASSDVKPTNATFADLPLLEQLEKIRTTTLHATFEDSQRAYERNAVYEAIREIERLRAENDDLKMRMNAMAQIKSVFGVGR